MTIDNAIMNIEPIEGFSVLKMKQEVQEQIYRETKGMNVDELIEYFHQGSERFHNEQNNSPIP